MRPTVFLIRLVLSGGFGVLLWRVFFPGAGPLVAAALAALMMVLAYVLESLRLRRTRGDAEP